MEQNKDQGGAAVRGEAVADSGWISVKDAMPPLRDGFILVTNNIGAMDAFDNMSHIWMTSMVHMDNDGDLSAFAHPGFSKVEGITHWRFAVPAAAPVAGSEPTELVELLRSIRPNYGAVGSRDVDVTAMRKKIDAAITILSARAADAPSELLDTLAELASVQRKLIEANAVIANYLVAADALDSQPTDLSPRYVEAPTGLSADVLRAMQNGFRNGESVERVHFDVMALLSSQPTDGGVRNG